MVDANGSNQKQLTLNAKRNMMPAISRDGRFIAFISNRTDKMKLWRMDIDGGNLKQLTDDSGEALKPEWSIDGTRILYDSFRDKKLNIWQLPLTGEPPTQLSKITADGPTISADGKLVACKFGEGTKESPVRLAIFSMNGGEPLQELHYPAVTKSPLFRWLPDGRSLAYLDAQDKVYNLFSQALSGGEPKQLTDFKTDRIYYFALSPDGKQVALARGRETADLVMLSNLK